ncbi:MAG: hypothetical protein RSA01_01970 [Clostridium sp.]|uniref:hypothetical protein n=1 Tax=Clostridium sp. TaxID=1506 RepID=UPI002FCB675D
MVRFLKIVDCLTWVMMVITFMVAVFTMLVAFGISWRSGSIYFINLKVVEICLAITLALWGTTAVTLKDKKSKVHGCISYGLCIILIIFVAFGIY